MNPDLFHRFALKSRLTQWAQTLHPGYAADLLLPRTCAGCSLAFEPGGQPIGWCEPCLSRLRCSAPRCPRCALEWAGSVCSTCASKPLPFARTLVLGAYAAPLDRIVRAMKFSRQPALAHTLAAALAPIVAHELDSWSAGLERPQVVPVPLSDLRLAERGYNQSLLIARPLARACSLELLPRALQRLRAGPPQSRLSPAAREHNVEQAFRAAAPVSRPVLLVDDVMTTGATLAAASRALLAAGAPSVTCVVVARTPLPDTPLPDVQRCPGSA